MTNTEELIPLNSTTFDVKRYFDFDIDIGTIGEVDSAKPIAFQFASKRTTNEVIELLLTPSALKSLERVPYQSSSTREEIRSLLNHSNFFCAENEFPDNDYIEWSSSSQNLKMKRNKFLEQIALYNNYDMRHSTITLFILEIIQYYIKEYLFREENFSERDIQKLEECFQDAIREQNYFIYFIKAYTMSGNFHNVLNKHLALYIIDYFDPYAFLSRPGRFRLINCLAHITGLSINNPDLHQYRYTGIVYRGLVLSAKDYECYKIGNYILNRSFVSTSQNRLVAMMFSGFEHGNNFEETSTQRCVLFKYKIEQNTTGLDIERISSIEDENEVLILPFSLFQVKNRKEIYSTKSSQILYEIDLDEIQRGILFEKVFSSFCM